MMRGERRSKAVVLLSVTVCRSCVQMLKEEDEKVDYSKIVHEAKSESKDESRNRLETETDEDVEEETGEKVEEETKEVIPIPYKKWANKRLSPSLIQESVYFELPVPIVNWNMRPMVREIPYSKLRCYISKKKP
ncbi:hypothetical protein ACH5RR_021143 [Cinchona calisaya]|uniref:Uncharacterized protein n=1 Tax=Cinchona calisaya TaxID=153742 RepID=A0ABD2ZHH5_9GENT